MNERLFGALATGEAVHLYTLTNGSATLTVTSYGARVVSFVTYGRDIVGGFDTLEGYVADDSHQGSTIGRVANRIEDASFTMDGAIYMLPDNDGGSCLHGGDGFDTRVWETKDASDDSVTFCYYSEDGEDGFPSGLAVTAKYTLSGSDLLIEYSATPDGKTPIALTNHTYFNLDGIGGDIAEHTVKLFADRYTAVNSNLIPTGERPWVDGTVYDLRGGRKIGEVLENGFLGYDNYFHLTPREWLDYRGKMLSLAAEISAGELSMRVFTDRGGIQFYTGNFLGTGPAFKGGVSQVRHGAMCLEAGEEPNAVRRGEGFFEAGETYTHTTLYSVSKK